MIIIILRMIYAILIAGIDCVQPVPILSSLTASFINICRHQTKTKIWTCGGKFEWKIWQFWMRHKQSDDLVYLLSSSLNDLKTLWLFKWYHSVVWQFFLIPIVRALEVMNCPNWRKWGNNKRIWLERRWARNSSTTHILLSLLTVSHHNDHYDYVGEYSS
jgi:hypothetical protein